MISINTSHNRLAKIALASCCLFAALVALPAPALQAADAPASTDKASNAPLEATFEKTSADKTPYVLHLKNTSSQELTVSGKILLASAFHSESKAKMLKEHKIAAGKTWTIKNLSVDDKVTVTAAGYDPLQLTVK
jgi:hypothetical protein